MAKKMKKVLSLVLVFSLMMSMLNVSAYATDGSNSNVADSPSKTAAVVKTVGNDEGIVMKLFDYNNSINSNGLDGYFEFRGACNDNRSYMATEKDENGNDVQVKKWEHSDYNKVWDDDGFKVTRTNVCSELDKNDFPVLDLSRTKGTEAEKANASLGYLFGSSTNPADTATVGVTEYTPTNTLLQYDEETGTYFYSSQDNAVDYDTSTNKFLVREYTERGSSTGGRDEECYDFLPFTYLKDGASLIYKLDENSNKIYHKDDDGNATNVEKSYYYDSETEMDYWFGMTMEFDFWMPEDGLINGQPMIFNFSGDDDVWVFIDDQLVLDLGGTHGVATGSINFSTGEVKQYLDWLKAGEGNTSDVYDTENTSKLVTAKTSYPTTLEARGITLEAGTKHTLKFFYLERGEGTSNCSMSFNMPVIPAGDVTVTKQVDGVVTEATDDTYTFTVYGKTEDEDGNVVSTPVAGVNYQVATLGSTEKSSGTTNSEGQFTLKANQMAAFDFNSDHEGTYYIVESPSENGNFVSTTTTLTENDDTENITVTNNGTSADFHVTPNKQNDLVFTNKLLTTNLKVSKTIVGNQAKEDDVFNFTIELDDASFNKTCTTTEVRVADSTIEGTQSAEAVAEDVVETETPATTVTFEDGKALIQLKGGESVNIEGLPLGMGYTVKETPKDGYTTAITVNGFAVTEAKGNLVATGTNVRFTNTNHIPVAGEWNLYATKTLDGEPAGGYTFKITGNDGTEAIVTSNANGVITYSKIFTEEGTFTYTISEVSDPNTTNIKFDESIYTITVVVTKNAMGDCVVTSSITEDGSAVNAITFTNATIPPYIPPYTPPVTPTPDPETPPVDVPDPDVPTGDMEADDPLYDLDDGDVPQDYMEVEDPDVPKTADNSNLMLWLTIAVLSALTLAGITIAERKAKN